jgi:hypothetical protein
MVNQFGPSALSRLDLLLLPPQYIYINIYIELGWNKNILIDTSKATTPYVYIFLEFSLDVSRRFENYDTLISFSR